MAAFVALKAQSWTPMAAGLLPNGYLIFSISAVSDDVVWAVASGEYYQAPIPATASPYILRTSNGGQTWTVHQVEEALATISFRIVAVDSLTAWITTQDYNGGAGRKLYKTTDGGLNWTSKQNDVSAGVNLSYFGDGAHWLAHNRQSVSRSENDGENWTNNDVAGYTSNEFQLLTSGTNMASSVGDTLWNGTSGGRILRFTEYGAASTFISTSFGTNTDISSIAFENHLNGLLYYETLAGIKRIARSSNGGQTWTSLPQQPGNFGWNITTVPGSPGTYVLASDYFITSGRVAITHNSGTSWSVEDVGYRFNAIEFTSPSSGWIGGGRITFSGQPVMFKYAGEPLVGTQDPPSLLGLSVFPNPASKGSVLTFSFEDQEAGERAEVALYDLLGRKCLASELYQQQLSLPASLPSGIYSLQLRVGDKVGVQRIVID